MAVHEVGVGLIGFGTVGTGMIRGLQRNGDLIERRTGIRLVLRRIADLDITSPRPVQVDPAILTTDAVALIEEPGVEIVVELIGGTSIARDLTLKALRLGKPVVTANKALLAKHGSELYRVAEENEADLYYEASVGGGIPIIRSLREGLVANHIESIYGILNGTCNYILTRMEEEGLAFDDVLKQAQEMGFAEAEPSLDIDGHDTAHKTAILASLSYGLPVDLAQMRVSGIRGLDPADLRYAKELGFRIKLLGIIKHDEQAGDVTPMVQPTLIPLGHPLAAVGGVFNAVLVRGDVVGDTIYSGRGAGADATGSAVLGDLVDVARNLVSESPLRIPAFVEHGHYGSVQSPDGLPASYYLRVSLLDQPGSLARIATILGEHNVSIAAMLQKTEPRIENHLPVVLLVEARRELDLREALDELNSLDVVGGPIVQYRIERFAT